eukprot:c6610_g1_i1.p1 GENE.c6610_g1_i1~~c6610_g1_i1.p1  ORF type:complete len:520 (+),score=132.81 c6610_g1_i1:53-1612(+)
MFLAFVGVFCGLLLLTGNVSTEVTGGSLVKPQPLFTKEFDVRDYGAIGDGVTVNTVAFTKAISAAHNFGGGLVTVTNGSFVVGAIQLLSNVYLNVENDAQVLGSFNVADYPGPWDDTMGPVTIGSRNAVNVGIVGSGVIDGQAVPHFIQYYDRGDDRLNPLTWAGHFGCVGECRPRLVQFYKSSFVLVRDVTIQNSPDWSSHYFLCANVLVDNVTVLGDWRWPNNDGIDPDGTVNMTIQNSFINVADDALCPKTSLPASAGNYVLDNLLIQDCIVRSKSSGFKIGSATTQNMTNILVQRVHIWNSNRGFAIQHRDEGHVHGVEFRDCSVITSYQPLRWWGCSEPVYLTSAKRSPDQTAIGTVGGITLHNITARSENGVVIASMTGLPLYDIRVSQLSIEIGSWDFKRSAIKYSTSGHDFRPSYLNVIAAPTDGVYFDNVIDSSLTDANITYVGPRDAVWGQCVNTQQSAVAVSNVNCVQPKSPHRGNVRGNDDEQQYEDGDVRELRMRVLGNAMTPNSV